MATRRTRLAHREYIVKGNAYVLAAHMVSFLYKFAHSMYPLISFALTFRMSPACAPRVRSEHIPTRKRHRISLLGRARLVVEVLPSPVAVVVGVCRNSSESRRGRARGLSGSGPSHVVYLFMGCHRIVPFGLQCPHVEHQRECYG